MKFLTALSLFVFLPVTAYASDAPIYSKSDGIKYAAEMLAYVLIQNHNFPKEEAVAFTECVENELRKNTTEDQKIIINQLGLEASKGNPSNATLDKSHKLGIHNIGSMAQEICDLRFYP